VLPGALFVAGLAHGQEWPQRPVRIIGPYAAGGNADVLARLTAQRLSDAFGQQFVVENRVGGNGIIAAEAVAHAPADGYTFLWGVLPPLAIQPALSKVPYDSLKDFAPISAVATNPFVLVVNKDLPVKTVAELIAWVRAQPAKPSYAEGAVGSVTHLAMALFLHRAGIAMTNVSYRGNAPALTDIARATKDPAFAARLASLGADPLGDTPDEFAARIAADLDLWAQAVVAAGIKRQ
jgi:tripartite-type tricarboxylate transporter receptor subunit TctC